MPAVGIRFEPDSKSPISQSLVVKRYVMCLDDEDLCAIQKCHRYRVEQFSFISFQVEFDNRGIDFSQETVECDDRNRNRDSIAGGIAIDNSRNQRPSPGSSLAVQQLHSIAQTDGGPRRTDAISSSNVSCKKRKILGFRFERQNIEMGYVFRRQQCEGTYVCAAIQDTALSIGYGSAEIANSVHVIVD
jgi:hypothetical protein